MFDKPLKFTCVSDTKILDSGPRVGHQIYKFQTKKKRVYHVHIEEYENKVFVVKYHLKIHENRKDRFKIIINDGNANQVIGTVLAITLTIWRANNYSSFAFIGVYKISLPEYRHKRESPDTARTQRFTIYQRLVASSFGKEAFLHSADTERNAYIMVSTKNPDTLNFLQRIVDMFGSIYNDFTELSS